MRVHTGDKVCTFSPSDRRFCDSSNLQEQKRYVHSSNRPYHCPYCGMLFKTSGNLRRHVHLHTGIKPYPCRLCSERFISRHQLKTHLLKSHSEGT